MADDVDVDVVGALEGWLQARPPTTLLGLADRLLIASVDRSRTEGPALAKRFAADVVVAASSVEVIPSFTTLCVAASALESFDVDVTELRFSLALASRVVSIDSYPEPFRSTARYWLWRAGLARSFVDDGVAPADPRLAFAFHTHRVLFAAGYGATPVQHAIGWDEAQAGVDVDCADSVALVLLCAACVGETVDLWGRLRELVADDGTPRTHVDSDAARHHAACVAVLAASLSAASVDSTIEEW
ncbi:MAG: hypothetical protein Q8O67_02240 [Deltaproteobacteria bacterium]|nr:hypothetical protein [Deltaproteobacteria bacterium]